MVLEASHELKRELQVPFWRFLQVSIQETVGWEDIIALQEQQSRALDTATNEELVWDGRCGISLLTSIPFYNWNLSEYPFYPTEVPVLYTTVKTSWWWVIPTG